uniref:Uncharacterized protein n=1 Tax=Rhizophora mucronata TaxID=61149 RepID=A0A2P2LN11_RHIMU
MIGSKIKAGYLLDKPVHELNSPSNKELATI